MTTDQKRCVYYVIGGEPEYTKVLEASLRSVRRFHPPRTLDVVVMCDASYRDHVSHIRDIRIIETPPNTNGLGTSMRKVQIPENLRKYERVLYLDCDIIVCASLDPLFDMIKDEGVLYTCTEGGPQNHRHIFWSLLSHTRETLETFQEKNIGVFNAGLFGFIPSDPMYAHFDTIQKMMDGHDGPYFLEQSFMNHYFAEQSANVSPCFTPRVKLEAREYVGGFILAHFTDASMPWRRKLAMMDAWTLKLDEVTRIDPYALLGVDMNWTVQSVRKRYYELACLCHPDKGGTSEQMNMLHNAYTFVTTQVSLNSTTTFEALASEFTEFCSAQESTPPPLADIFADAFEIPRFNQVYDDACVQHIDGAFADGGYDTVPSCIPGNAIEYSDEPDSTPIEPFESTLVIYEAPEPLCVPDGNFRDITGATLDSFSCHVGALYVCDYKQGLAPPPPSPPFVEPVADISTRFEAYRKRYDQ